MAKLERNRKKTGGRAKGTPNKTTALLKDAILEAAKRAGGGDDDGLVSYLQAQAVDNPGPFLGLVGKVLPMQVTGKDGEPLVVVPHVIRLVGPDGK